MIDDWIFYDFEEFLWAVDAMYGKFVEELDCEQVD